MPATYVVPTEGQLTWVCGYGIATQTKNLDAAYAALNWYNSPEPQAFYAKSYTYWVFDQDPARSCRSSSSRPSDSTSPSSSRSRYRS